MRFLGSAVISLLLALLIVLGARSQSVQLIHMDSPSAAAYAGPGDVLTFSEWWGFVAYSSATRGNNSVNLCDPTGTTCADVATDATTGLLNSPGTIGGTACSVLNTCVVKILYDNSGHSKDITNATNSKRPTFIWNCVNGLPCMACSRSANQFLSRAAIGNDNYSYSVVWTRTGSTTSLNEFVGTQTTELYQTTSANTMNAGGSGAMGTATANDNAWHAVNATLKSSDATSFYRVDGTTVTASPGSNLVGSLDTLCSYNGGATSLDGKIAQGGIIAAGSNTLMTTGNASTLNTQQHTLYGF